MTQPNHSNISGYRNNTSLLDISELYRLALVMAGLSPFPPSLHHSVRAHRLEQHVGDESVDDCTYTQRHHVHRTALVQVIQSEDFFASIDRTTAIRQPLGRCAVKVLTVE